MKTSLKTLAGVVCGAGLLASATMAQDSEHKLSDFKLGEHISGPEIDLEKLEGKVVVVDYWGTR